MEERCREDGLKTWNNYSILKINKICGINWKLLKCIWDSISDAELQSEVLICKIKFLGADFG